MGEADASKFVDIPGDTTLWKTQGIPPTRIQLPLEARGRFRWYYPIFGLAAVWALSSSAKFYSVTARNWDVGNWLARIEGAAALLGCFFVGVLFAGMFVRALSDAMSSRPLLILTRETLWDSRQLNEPMPWSNVENVRFQSTRVDVAAHLKLAQPVFVRSGLFRFGGAVKSGFKSNLIVLISDLDNEGVIDKVIVALANNVET